MPHIHISTGALFVSALGAFGLTGLLVWAFKKPKLEPKPVTFVHRERYPSAQRGSWAPSTHYSTPATHYAPPVSPAPAYYPPPSYPSHNDGLLTGLVLGEMLAGSHHDTTVIHDHGGGGYYEGVGGGYSDTSTYDSGVSYSDSGSSYDSGSSGGIDIDF
jgi:hypothetical protein